MQAIGEHRENHGWRDSWSNSSGIWTPDLTLMTPTLMVVRLILKGSMDCAANLVSNLSPFLS